MAFRIKRQSKVHSLAKKIDITPDDSCRVSLLFDTTSGLVDSPKIFHSPTQLYGLMVDKRARETVQKSSRLDDSLC
jgi:hypothetical protein